MKTLVDAGLLMGQVIGDHKLFDKEVNEYICLARAIPILSNENISDAKIKTRFEKYSKNIISNSIKNYIQQKYGESVTINSNGVYDANMQPIAELDEIRKRQAEIKEILVTTAMTEYKKGKALADQIIKRTLKNIEELKAVKQIAIARDYEELPPLEALEVEVIKLENKLPCLSKIEGQRLAQLYEMLRNQKELEEELIESFKNIDDIIKGEEESNA